MFEVYFQSSKFCRIVIVIALTLFCLLDTVGLKAQSKNNAPDLGEFLAKLRTISPVKDQVTYETFSNFDFTLFKPAPLNVGASPYRYVVGSTRDKQIRSVSFFFNDNFMGKMNVYDFSTSRILTFQTDSVLNPSTTFSVFCISEENRFAFYLNKPFQYYYDYKPTDIAAIQILREDFFPVYILTIKDNLIRIVSEVSYVNGASKSVDSVNIMFVFNPQAQSKLMIRDQCKFIDEELHYIPRADFVVNLRPKSSGDGIPLWLQGKIYIDE
ncbi:MAG: hypothetical protein ACOYXT_03575 [Bacteroidota bacterium]